MRRMEERFRRKAMIAAAAGFLAMVLPRLCRILFGLYAGRTCFAGQKVGVVTWKGKRGEALFCSTRYDPERSFRVVFLSGGKALFWGLSGILRSRCGKMKKDCKK